MTRRRRRLASDRARACPSESSISSTGTPSCPWLGSLEGLGGATGGQGGPNGRVAVGASAVVGGRVGVGLCARGEASQRVDPQKSPSSHAKVGSHSAGRRRFIPQPLQRDSNGCTQPQRRVRGVFWRARHSRRRRGGAYLPDEREIPAHVCR